MNFYSLLITTYPFPDRTPDCALGRIAYLLFYVNIIKQKYIGVHTIQYDYMGNVFRYLFDIY